MTRTSAGRRAAPSKLEALLEWALEREQERAADNAEERSRGEAGLLYWENNLAVKMILSSAGYTPLAVLVIYDCIMSRESPSH